MNDTIDKDALEALRLTNNYSATVGVRKALVEVAVRKPDRQWFVRTNKSQDFRIELAILERRDERETYLVYPQVQALIPDLITPVCLFTAINRQDIVFLWPIKLPGGDGRITGWHRSAFEAATRALDRWVRVVPNMTAGAYDVFEATADLPEPNWPDETFLSLINVGFKNKILDTPEHPLVKTLRGER